jgi:hypothetical protein
LSLGIGGGMSRRLAADGAHVVLADTNSDAASATREKITAAGGRCTVVVGDIRDRDVVAELTKTARPDQDVDPGGPVRQARRLRGGGGVPGVRRRAVRHRTDDRGGRRHAGRLGWHARADRKGWTNMPNEA